MPLVVMSEMLETLFKKKKSEVLETWESRSIGQFFGFLIDVGVVESNLDGR